MWLLLAINAHVPQAAASNMLSSGTPCAQGSLFCRHVDHPLCGDFSVPASNQPFALDPTAGHVVLARLEQSAG
jgi:hypothetical protein